MKKPLLSEMTLREKIGQCLLVYQWDIYGKVEADYDFSKSSIEEVIAIHEKEQFGVIFGEQIGIYCADPDNANDYNFGLANQYKVRVPSASYKKFMEKQSSYLKYPPLIPGDFTNGGANVFEDLSTTCNAPAIGAADSEELTYELAANVGKELRCAGVNWRWYPVVDLGNRNSTSIMRTFAPDDVDRNVKLASAYIHGMQSAGVAACAKHFPGPDRNSSRDSHFTSTMNTATMEDWWSEQGQVFQRVIDSGVYSVMISHTAFPAADDTKINGKYIPSTLSKKIITDLLKEKMGFKGVVVTDGITMAGLYSLLPYEELIVGLINAGNDVILGAKLPSGDILEKAVLDGRIPMSRIDDACQRVLDMKEKLGLFEEGHNDLPYKAEDIVPQTKKISAEIARRSMTLVRDRNNLLPVDKSKIKKVSVIVSSHKETFIDSLKHMKAAFEERGIEVYMQRRLKSTPELEKIAKDSDLIIYAAYVGPHCPKGGLRLYGEECETFYHAFNYGKERSIGVSFGYPYIHYDIMENADAFINAYGASADAQRAFVEAILGEIELSGKSPVLLQPRANSY